MLNLKLKKKKVEMKKKDSFVRYLLSMTMYVS